MRAAPVLLAPVVAGLLLAAPAGAQVTTNSSALDDLGTTRAPPRSTPHHPARPAPRPATPATPATHATPAKPTANPAPPAPAKTAKPEIPATPPAILALPPPVAVPLARPPPAPVVPLADDAPGDATAIPHGVRVTFGTGRADFKPATAAAITAFAGDVREKASTSIDIFAYAPGSQDDPSTPRRLSLERALAARAVLLQAGIASTRIYPRALGGAGGDMPDRVDIVTGTTTPPPVGPAG